jgi:two-component system NtrC family sensor kinase
MMIQNNRILVIDDEPDMRDCYHRILSSELACPCRLKGASFHNKLDNSSEHIHNTPYELTLVESGEEGIHVVKESLKKKEPFAVAFVDMVMDGLNGAETIAWMWQIDQNIKVVIVTGHSQYLSEDCVMVTGRDDLFYLRKPFNSEEIIQFARALTKQWSLARQMDILTYELMIAHEKLEDMNKNLQKKVEEQTTMLIQTDKMASIGLLAAGVAHEVNNPISFVDMNLTSLKSYTAKIISLFEMYREMESYIKEEAIQFKEKIQGAWSQFKMDFIMDDMMNLIQDSLEGTKRVNKIVSDLKTFARVKEEDIEPINLNDIIDSSLNILRNELKNKIEIIKNYGELPMVKCFVLKMSQVFVNILTNAAQAIKQKGTIRIVTKHIRDGEGSRGEYAELRFSDTGIGIPKENITKIFDPFFTTKPVGVGTGLGMKITYDIIKAHGGEIMAESEVGHGTTFIIRLPLEPALCS